MAKNNSSCCVNFELKTTLKPSLLWLEICAGTDRDASTKCASPSGFCQTTQPPRLKATCKANNFKIIASHSSDCLRSPKAITIVAKQLLPAQVHFWDDF